jgi:NADH:ubiquinone reductase (H+-translocating)
MRKLVILGGGYGGTAIVHELLEKDLPSDTVIYLIDRMPYQGLKTEYYALAAGSAAEKSLRVPFPVHPHLIMFYGEITGISLEDKLVYLEDQDPLSYDWLVIGLGCVDNYQDIPGAEENASSLQTLSGARRTYLKLQEVRPYGHVSIIGGGLSGIEIASELRECRPDLNIRILDQGDGILSAFPEKLRLYVHGWFLENDVEVRSNVVLGFVEEEELMDGNKLLPSHASVWTAGIQPAPLVQALKINKDDMGRVRLDAFHRVPAYPDVFVVGDCAGIPFSPSAQAAEAQGRQIAQVIRAIWDNVSPQLGVIRLRGTLGALGKKSGFGIMGDKTVVTGKVPRALKSGALWRSKRHFG